MLLLKTLFMSTFFVVHVMNYSEASPPDSSNQDIIKVERKDMKDGIRLMLVDEKHKFIFCPIQKVISNQAYVNVV